MTNDHDCWVRPKRPFRIVSSKVASLRKLCEKVGEFGERAI